MRKQSTNNASAVNACQNQGKEAKKAETVKIIKRYIYTEEDLGEGILDAGVNMPYIKGGRGNQNLQPWN